MWILNFDFSKEVIEFYKRCCSKVCLSDKCVLLWAFEYIYLASAKSCCNEWILMFTPTLHIYPNETEISCVVRYLFCFQVFFYSKGIFRTSGIEESQLQYYVLLANAINVIMTVVAVPVNNHLN